MNNKKIETFAKIFIFVLIVSNLSIIAGAYISSDGYTYTPYLHKDEKPFQTPTQEEKDLFKAIATRLVQNKDKWPINVQNIIDGAYTTTINCPRSGSKKIKQLIIFVSTGFTSYDGRCDQNGKSVRACYIWRPQYQYSDGDTKIFRAYNKIQINPNILRYKEKSQFGQWENEGILYHELLHGQLTLNDLLKDDDWIADVCNCSKSSVHIYGYHNLDEHAEIRKHQGDYVDGAAGKNGYNLGNVAFYHTVNSEDRNFEVRIDYSQEDIEKMKDLYYKENRLNDIHSYTKNMWVTHFETFTKGGMINDKPVIDYFILKGTISSGNQGTARVIFDPDNFTVSDYVTVNIITNYSSELECHTCKLYNDVDEYSPIYVEPSTEDSSPTSEYPGYTLGIFTLGMLIVGLVLISISTIMKKEKK